MKNPRRVAAGILFQVISEGKSLTEAIRLLDRLSPADRPFVQAACYGVLRWYHRLDFLLGQLASKPIKDTEVKILALLGLYQLAFMEIKPHAAVSETVAAAGRKSWAKPFLNALLRNFQRRRAMLETLVQADAGAAISHPNWLRQRLEQDWPGRASEIFTNNNRQAPMTVRVNLSQISRSAYRQRLEQAGIITREVPGVESALVLDHPVAVDKLPGFAEGKVSVQDAAAQLAAPLLGVEPGQRVLDVCAAPGGKTLHLLEYCPHLQELVALDCDGERLKKIEANLARAGGGFPVRLQVGDARHVAEDWKGQYFDRILLDAPCSATGVIRRHPDIKLLRRETDLPKTAGLQEEILEAVWHLLSPGGILLYSTCSVLKQENQFQIESFLASHPDAEVLPIEADWGHESGPGRQIFTGENTMDGFFYSRLRKCPCID